MKKIIILIYWLLKKITYVSAITIIIVAALLGVVRMLTPVAAQYKNKFEFWASEQLHVPVHIQQLEATWRGFTPMFKLQRVTLLDDKQKVSITLDKLYIGLDVVKSLISRKLRPGRIIISGATLSIQQQHNGRWTVPGISHSATSKPTKDIRQLQQRDQALSWLFKQRQLSLRDIVIDVQLKQGKHVLIKQLNAEWSSHGSQHRLTGKTVVRKNSPTALSFVIDLEGEQFNRQQLQAKFYLQAKRLAIHEWMQEVFWDNMHPVSGVVDVITTGKIKKGKFKQVQVQFDSNNLCLATKNKQSILELKKASGLLNWEKLSHRHWRLAGKQLQWTFKNKKWQEQDFLLEYTQDKVQQQSQWSFKSNYLHVDELVSLLKHSSLLSSKQKKLLQKLQPNGELQHVEFLVKQQNGAILDYHFLAEVRAWFSKAWQHFPAISNISGRLQFSKKSGNLLIDSYNGELHFKNIFRQKFPFQHLVANLQWQLDLRKNIWQVQVPNWQIKTSKVSSNGQLKLYSLNSLTPNLEILANVHAQDLQRVDVYRYLPVAILNKQMIKWLDNGIRYVEQIDSNILLRGPINAFPFDKNKGVFVVNNKVKNAKLAYLSGWPMAKNINGDLTFNGRAMQFNGDVANLAGNHVKELRASIFDIGNAELHLSMITDLNLNNALSFLKHTPLDHEFDNVFSKLQGVGDSDLHLNVIVPIIHNKVTTAKVNGNLLLKNARLKHINWDVALEKTSGKISFTENSINAEKLYAQVFGEPVIVAINSINSVNQPLKIQASLHGKIGIKQLQQHVSLPLNNYLAGATTFKSELFLSEKLKSISISSDLVGVHSNLPKPVSKQKQQAVNSNIKFLFDTKNEFKVQFSYGESIKGDFVFSDVDQYAHLKLKNIAYDPEQLQKGSSLKNDIEIQSSAVSKWKTLLSAFLYKYHSGKVEYALSKVNLSIPQFNFLGQTFTKVKLGLSHVQDGWELLFHSNEAQGTIDIPHDWHKQAIFINFEYIDWNSTAIITDQKKFYSLPMLTNVDIHIDKFNYNGSDLGQVDLQLLGQQHGTKIKALVVHGPGFNLQAKGQLTNGVVTNTHLQGQLVSDDVVKALSILNVDKHIESQQGRLAFDVQWPGSVNDFNLGTLSGQAFIRIKDGRVVGLGKDTDAKLNLGKLINLLSLQNLPKRLQFNFNDLTHKGYYFDKMQADILFKQGNAIAKDVILDGQVAHVELSGRIGLQQHDYDLQLSIMPNITSSLPVVATIAGGPIVGAVTLIADKVVGPKVNKITRHLYAITGMWEHPNIQQIKKKRHA